MRVNKIFWEFFWFLFFGFALLIAGCSTSPIPAKLKGSLEKHGILIVDAGLYPAKFASLFYINFSSTKIPKPKVIYLTDGKKGFPSENFYPILSDAINKKDGHLIFTDLKPGTYRLDKMNFRLKKVKKPAKAGLGLEGIGPLPLPIALVFLTGAAVYLAVKVISEEVEKNSKINNNEERIKRDFIFTEKDFKKYPELKFTIQPGDLKYIGILKIELENGPLREKSKNMEGKNRKLKYTYDPKKEEKALKHFLRSYKNTNWGANALARLKVVKKKVREMKPENPFKYGPEGQKALQSGLKDPLDFLKFPLQMMTSFDWLDDVMY